MPKKTEKSSIPSKGEIILYQSPDGKAALDVRLEGETLWLNLNQMAGLFERDKSVVSRHLGNIFKTGELERNSVVAFFATTAADGKTYQVEYFNLDAITLMIAESNPADKETMAKLIVNLINSRN
jgi:hypothetical protein